MQQEELISYAGADALTENIGIIILISDGEL